MITDTAAGVRLTDSELDTVLDALTEADRSYRHDADSPDATDAERADLREWAAACRDLYRMLHARRDRPA